MLITVDLPAPFSPMMPTMDPLGTDSDTPRLAWTGPKNFSMPLNSRAGGAASEMGLDINCFALRAGQILQLPVLSKSCTLILPAIMSALARSTRVFMAGVIRPALYLS